MVKVLDYGLEVNEFELQSRYYELNGVTAVLLQGCP